MTGRQLLPLLVGVPRVMHVAQPRAWGLRTGDKVTYQEIHINTRIVQSDGTVLRRFWVPDSTGARCWGWMKVPVNSVWSEAPHGWYFVQLKVTVNEDGGVTLHDLIDSAWEYPITPAA